MDQEIDGATGQLVHRLLNLPRQFSWKKTFLALKYPNYRLWFLGQMVSLFGSWMQSTAQGFLVYELTHSPAYLGYVGFAAGLPSWLFMLYGGVVADRIPRRRILIITQSAMMLLAFILAALAFLHMVQPWHIVLLALGMGVANAFDAPARQAFILEMVESKALTNAIALNSAMFNGAVALGPAAGGLIYAALGPAWCFTINGITFIAVIAALAAMKLKPFLLRQMKNSILQDFRIGIKYVLRHSTIRILILTVAVMTLFGNAFTTLLPAWAVRILHGDARTNGFLLASRGLGALLGALFIASFGHSNIRGKLLTLGSFIFPIFTIFFAFSRLLPLSLVFLLGAGASLILVFNLCNALVQLHTNEEIRGRVMSIYSFVFFGLMPFGALWIGQAAHYFGEAFPVFLSAAITLAYSLIIFLLDVRVRKLQ